MINFIKKYKTVILCIALTAAALVTAFFAGNGINDGNVAKSDTSLSVGTQDSISKSLLSADDEQDSAGNGKSSSVNAEKSQTNTTDDKNASDKDKQTSKSATQNNGSSSNIAQSSSSGSSSSPTSADADKSNSYNKNKDKYRTDPVPEGKPEPVEPQEQIIEDTTLYCTFSISCDAILDNTDMLDPDKAELVPDNGWIFKPEKISFNSGESVFDVLQKVCRENKIHMEASWTPIYNTAYIEGINNLYEFDCGSQSGWMYSVNGWFPNYGCSRYELKNGDVVEWRYTCDNGYDIGKGMTSAE